MTFLKALLVVLSVSSSPPTPNLLTPPPPISSAPVTNRPSFKAHRKLLQWRQASPSAPSASVRKAESTGRLAVSPSLLPPPSSPVFIYLSRWPSVPVSCSPNPPPGVAVVSSSSIPSYPLTVFVYICLHKKWTMKKKKKKKKTCSALDLLPLRKANRPGRPRSGHNRL